MNDRFLNIHEGAKYLRDKGLAASYHSLRRLLKAGKIGYSEHAGKIYTSAQDLECYIDSCRKSQSAKAQLIARGILPAVNSSGLSAHNSAGCASTQRGTTSAPGFHSPPSRQGLTLPAGNAPAASVSPSTGAAT
jgi:hypothetical protein